MLRFIYVYFLGIITVVNTFLCCKSENKYTKIFITVQSPASGKIFLSKVGFMEEKDRIVDSSFDTYIYNDTFKVLKDPTSLYAVSVPWFNQKVYCIADADEIYININLATKSFKVNGSVSSDSYYNFLNELKDAHSNSLNHIQANVSEQNITDKTFTLPFIDTVSNPVLFITAYNTVDFGNDLKLWKKVVDKAEVRFPSVIYIHQLKTDAYRMIDVYEKEFNVNDSLPVFSLLNSDSVMFSTASLKGKYYLINFWSTWCSQCFGFMESIKQSYAAVDTSKITFISAAIDDNKADWKRIINQHQYNWINLIDEKMWKGDAVNTLKFDSIPFSFLVSPKGIVLAKAITPDSINVYLKKYHLNK